MWCSYCWSVLMKVLRVVDTVDLSQQKCYVVCRGWWVLSVFLDEGATCDVRLVGTVGLSQ